MGIVLGQRWEGSVVPPTSFLRQDGGMEDACG